MPLARRHLVPAMLVLACAAIAPSGVVAQDAPPEPRDAQGQPEQRPSEHRALSDAVRRVERATNGQVLSAERVQFDGRDVNRVKIIDGRGRVRVYWDDPQAPRAERNPPRQERPRRGAREEPVRRDDPPRRTRGHDGRAFNL